MFIQVLSDLHFEMHADLGSEFIQSIEPNGVDVLVLAGDISTQGRIVYSLPRLCDRFKDSEVVMVLGNHEYYWGTPEKVMSSLRRMEEVLPNLHILENQSVLIKNRRFIGCTLWFPEDPMNPHYLVNLGDYNVIPGFIPWVYEKNRESIRFLEQTLRKDDILITHHLPCNLSSGGYKNSPMNRFFLCDISDLIMDREPELAIHGHSHISSDYYLGPTRVICNPLGYPDAINPEWNGTLRIET